MSTNLTVYVGPYLQVHKIFDYTDFDSLLTDGRGEAGVYEKDWCLIPNQRIPGIPERQTDFDRYADTERVIGITEHRVKLEREAFEKWIETPLQKIKEEGLQYTVGWGVVPGWK